MKLANILNTHRILITSQIHGDEPASDIIAEKLQQRLPHLTYMRQLNPSGKRNSQGKDPNRSFPNGTSIAKNVVEVMKNYNAIIDIHTADVCKPFILVDDTENMDEIVGWAGQAGLLMAKEGGVYEDDNLDRSLSGYFAKQGKRAITVEVDDHDRSMDEAVVHGLVNMIHNYDSSKPSKVYVREDLTSDLRGELKWYVDIHDSFEAGDVIASIGGKPCISEHTGFLLARISDDEVSDDYIGMVAKDEAR
jgi:predicted deacylase